MVERPGGALHNTLHREIDLRSEQRLLLGVPLFYLLSR